MVIGSVSVPLEIDDLQDLPGFENADVGGVRHQVHQLDVPVHYLGFGVPWVVAWDYLDIHTKLRH